MEQAGMIGLDDVLATGGAPEARVARKTKRESMGDSTTCVNGGRLAGGSVGEGRDRVAGVAGAARTAIALGNLDRPGKAFAAMATLTGVGLPAAGNVRMAEGSSDRRRRPQ